MRHGRRRRGLFVFASGRQQDAERRSLPRRAGHLEGAVVAADDTLDRGEPQAPARELGGEIRVENAAKYGWIDARAVVVDFDGDVIPRGHVAAPSGPRSFDPLAIRADHHDSGPVW